MTSGLPSVTVPVLSNMTALIFANASKCFPPLIKIPARDALDRDDRTAGETDATRAQGDPTTNTTIPLYSASL